MRLALQYPDYSLLSKRLKALNIKCPRYLNHGKKDSHIAAIAIDSTGLKRFGRDEWHQERHKVNARRSWRKAHFGIDENHYIQAAMLTDRFTTDDEVVDDLLDQIDADVVIPPAKNALIGHNAHPMRNRNVAKINANGRINWQRARNYGQRNYSELGVPRYKRILGRAVHARIMPNQKQEFMIGCGVLNKMTSLGMPDSFRVA
jgi:Transposase DDE domain